jgi:hypothetical protein
MVFSQLVKQYLKIECLVYRECRDPGMYDTMKHRQMSKGMLLGMVVVVKCHSSDEHL